MFGFDTQLIVIVAFVIHSGGGFSITTSAEHYCEDGYYRGCGNGFNISYPFYSSEDLGGSSGNCGYPSFVINCWNGRPVVNISNSIYYVLKFDTVSLSLRVVGMDVDEQECPRPTHNVTEVTEEATSPFNSNYFSNWNVNYFYNCSSYPKHIVQHLPCLDTYYNNSSAAGLRSFAFLDKHIPNGEFDWYANCEKTVVVPAVRNTFNTSDYKGGLKLGFDLSWSKPDECKYCESSGGHCWFNKTSGAISWKVLREFRRPFLCYCQAKTRLYDGSCPKKEAPSGPFRNITGTPTSIIRNRTHIPIGLITTKKGVPTALKVIIGVCTGVGGGGLLLTLLLIYRRKCSLCPSIISSLKSKIRTPTNVEVFLESGGCFGLQRYGYSEIKKITNSFTEMLGQGGFGTVFKGKLSDGRLVAVKVLNEIKGNGEDFINEITTIGRTNHVNVASLLGLCSDGTRRALVYEFMSNGSLEKFIYDRENASTTNPPLGWEKLYHIALGIAKGLEYLHHGCNTRILHFDIKPHNILLDQDFCPKITDFGLAKLCPTREHDVSMSCSRGTAGYIAPEVGSSNFGGASHKSDVYSYGMMVLEIIGGRKNIDVRVQNISEIYFPHWIYNHCIQDMDVDSSKEIYTEETTKKMITVALWCIQQKPTDRPSISEVIEMLEGNIEELQMPPNPFQCPPPQSFP